MGDNPFFHKMRVHVAHISFFGGLLLLAGCGTIRQEPFAEFSNAVQQLRKGADEALRYNDELNRSRFIEETAEASERSDGADAVENLLIEGIAAQPFAWKMTEVPLFMASLRFRSGIYTLNSTLLAYSELLSDLADSGLVSQKEFDLMAKDLNSNLIAAATALKFEGSEKSVGIISVAASRAAYAYIDHRRRDNLREVLEKNQPLIEDLSQKLQGAIRLAARNLRQDYEQRSKRLADQLIPNPSVGLSARKKTVEALVELNEDYLMRLGILEALHNSYRSLPSAHRELNEAVTKPGYNLASVNELFENGKHLYGLYKDLQKKEK
jgi:hypothetical protein